MTKWQVPACPLFGGSTVKPLSFEPTVTEKEEIMLVDNEVLSQLGLISKSSLEIPIEKKKVAGMLLLTQDTCT